MKKLYILSALIILYTQTFAQWPARYNPANKVDQGRLVVVDANNNIYVTGRSQDKKGNDDYATIKYNSSGVQQWAARYNGTGNGYDIPNGLFVDNAGNVYITGSSAGAGTDYDFATIKYNAAGAQQWAVRYDGPTHTADAAKDIKVDASGNVFITGYADGSSVGVTGSSAVTIKYNSNGILQWADRYDGVTTSEDANSLVLDNNGNIYTTGESGGVLTIKYNDLGASVQREWVRTYGSSGNGRKIEMGPDGNVVIGAWSYTTLKYDPAGNLLWNAVYSGPGNSDGLWDMALDVSGNVYTTGYSLGTDGSNDYVTVKFNSSGTQQWVARYSGAGAARDHARAIAVDNSGNAYVTGFTQPNNSRTETPDYLTVKYNNAGQEEWAARYDGANAADGAFSIALDNLGNVYVTGESSTKPTNYDYATVRYSQNMTTKSAITNPLAENKRISFGLQNYPNPFIHTTTIEYQIPKNGKVKLSIYDMQGKEIAVLVNESKVAGAYKINFAANKLAAGSYVCRMQVGEMIETKKIIVIK